MDEGHKTLLVTRGFTLDLAVDFFESFSVIVKS